LKSEPQSASVIINGREAGSTPLVLPSIIPGAYTIQLKHPAYVPIDLNVNLIPGAKMDVTESFKDFSESYNQWKKKQAIVQYFNLAFAGTGQIFVSHRAPDFALIAAGSISDLFLLAACSQYRLNRRDYHDAVTPEAIAEDQRLKKWDYFKVTTMAISSLSLRVGTFFLTRLKKGY
jgi:hypothetical protein